MGSNAMNLPPGFTLVEEPEDKLPKGFVLDDSLPEGFVLVEEEETDVEDLLRLKESGQPLTEKQERILWKANEDKPLVQKASEAVSTFFPAAVEAAKQIGAGGAQLFYKGVLKPIDSMSQSPEEAAETFKNAKNAWKSFAIGAVRDVEETADAAIRFGMFGSGITDWIQGLPEEERFKRYQNRNAMRQFGAALREETPDRAAALLAENPFLQKAAGAYARLQGGTPEEVKLAEQAFSELMLENGLTKDEIDENIAMLGEFYSPFALPGANRATAFLAKGTGKVVQKAGEGALKYLAKPTAAIIEEGANLTVKGTELLQGATRRIGEYTVNDPDTLLKSTVDTVVVAPVVVPAKITRSVAGTVRDVLRQADSKLAFDPITGKFFKAGGSAGRRGMFEEAGRSLKSRKLTRQVFGPEGRGGVARAKLADWAVRQTNAIVQPGVNGAALNAIMGLPDIETGADLGEISGTGFGIGGFAGSRAFDRTFGLIDPTTSMAQKINNFITPDPAQRRRDEDADISRFLATADPQLVAEISTLADINRRKTALDSMIINLKQRKERTINRAGETELQRRIDAYQKQRDALEKATPQTQTEALRQTHLAFIDAMDLAQSTGGAAGIKNLKVKILNPTDADGFFRNLYGKNLSDAESTVQLLTGVPQLSNEDAVRLQQARETIAAFERDVANAKNTRGFAVSEDNADPNRGDVVPAHLRKVGHEGATVVINGELLKHLSEQGFDVRRVMMHETQHALGNFKEVQELLKPIREYLFDQKIQNADGTFTIASEGVYRDEDLDRFADAYAIKMSPNDGGASFRAQFDSQESLRTYIKEEVLSEMAAAGGDLHGGSRAALDDVGRSVVDWVETTTKNGFIKRLKEGLRGFGIIVDDAGGYSRVLGAEFTPESLAMFRQYQRQLRDLQAGLVFNQQKAVDEPDIPIAKIVASRALQEKFKNADLFEKENIIRATAPDGSVTELAVPQGAALDPFIDVYTVRGGQIVDSQGNPVQLGPMISVGSLPEGTKFEAGTRIARNTDGSPRVLTNREMQRRAIDRAKAIRNAFDSAKNDDSPSRLIDTGNGSYRGTMSQSQRDALLALPNTLVAPELKRKILFLNEILGRRDGTRVIMDYQAALLNGKYRSLAPKIRDEIPIGFQFSKDGNFLVTTMSVSRMYDKAAAWAAQQPVERQTWLGETVPEMQSLRLQLWNGDIGKFWDSVMKYLDNHNRGVSGSTDLHPDPAIALRMKNRINDLFNAFNAETKDSNPERTKLPKRRGEDPLDVVVRSRRLDRVLSLEESALQKMPINYELLTQNYMPEENPLAGLQSPEDFSRNINGSVSATEIRNAIRTDRVDQLESKMRDNDDLRPFESIHTKVVDGIPQIQIVSMFDPANEASIEPEEVVRDLDRETNAEIQRIIAQQLAQGIAPEQEQRLLNLGYTKVYRGISGEKGGLWWTDDIDAARTYAMPPNYAVEVGFLPPNLRQVNAEGEDWNAQIDIEGIPADADVVAGVEGDPQPYNSYRVADDVIERMPRTILEQQQPEQPQQPEQQIQTEEQKTGVQFMPAEIEAPSGERGFQSKLQMEIQRKFKGATATPEQLKAVINNPQNVKSEEVKWSGVNDAIDSLASENNGKVPVQELLNYLRDEGQVKFEEVTLGGKEPFDANRLAELEAEYKNLKEHPVDDPSFGEEKYDELIRLMNIRDQSTTDTLYDEAERVMKLAQQAQKRGDKKTAEKYFRENEFLNTRAEKLDLQGEGLTKPPKFGKYQLSGGENYREVVMTMPVKVDLPKGYEAKQEQGQWGVFAVPDDGNIYGEGSTRNQAIQRANEYLRTGKTTSEVDPSYTSSHFSDIPNYVAHMRLNERTDAEGNDGLFVEEFQSDRHQAGREKGYKPEDYNQRISELNKKISELNQKQNDIHNQFVEKHGEDYTIWPKDILEKEMSLLNPINEELFSLLDQRVKLNVENDIGVPDAPFRKDWSLQLFKRALRDAVESGKQWIGWTTGDTQAERYNLSKQVGEIRYWKANEDGSQWGLQVIEPNGQTIMFEDEYISPQKVVDTIGKEMFDKMQNGDGDDIGNDSKSLSGDNLKIGGEGMKGFYDQILPKEIGKYVGKMGGKVEKSKIDNGVNDLYRKQLLKLAQSNEPEASEAMELWEENEAWSKVPIWRVNITPQMENVVRAGQLQFMPDDNDFAKLRAEATKEYNRKRDEVYQTLYSVMPEAEEILRKKNAFADDQAIFNSIPISPYATGFDYDRSFHLTKIVRRILDDLDPMGYGQVLRGALRRQGLEGKPEYEAELQKRIENYKDIVRKNVNATNYTFKVLADLTASLPEIKARDLRQDKIVSPWMVLQKHFPNGEKRDINEILLELRDVIKFGVQEENFKSSINDVLNAAEVLRDFVDVDQTVMDQLFKDRYNKTENEMIEQENEFLKEITNPEFYDVEKQGSVTFSKKIEPQGGTQFMPPEDALEGIQPLPEEQKPQGLLANIPVVNEEEATQESQSELKTTGIEVPEFVDEQSVISNALRVANSKPWQKGRDFKVELQNRVLDAAKKAGVNISERTVEAIEYLSRVGLKDALIALEQNPNAIGWYDEKTRQALEVMSLLFPEIATDENARFAFTWALAVTSNGLKVDKNFELAEGVYRRYRKTGKMPTDIKAGQAQAAINEGLGLFNQLVKEWGMDNTRKFMQTDFSVGEISRLNKELSPGGEYADTTVRGSAILGPKIGNGFFSNLYGIFDALTMDRWLVRTWGRWTGTLLELNPELTQQATTRMQDAVTKLTAEDKARFDQMIGKDIAALNSEELAVAIQKASMKPELRDVMNQTETGEELRKSGNGLAKYLDGQKEAPANPAERNFIREIFGLMLDELRTDPKYADLTMADLQAVLWYAEKRLYETAKIKADQDNVDSSDADGYEDDEAPDYANAAASVARKKGVSDKRIKEALQKVKNDIAATARSKAQEGTAQAGPQGQQKNIRGFAGKEKREFKQYVAVTTARRNRTGNEKVLWSYARGSGGTGSNAGVLKPKTKKNLGVKYISEWKPGRKLATMFRNNELPTVKFLELDSTDEGSAQKFADTLQQSKNSSPYGAAVFVYQTTDYQKMKLFLSESGKSGFAVKPDGDIVSVFSMEKGSGRSVMEAAIAAGGKKLDAFDTILPEFYGDHGFVEAARIPWNDEMAKETMPDWDKQTFQKYNNGEPDVVMMVLDPKFTGEYQPRTDIYAADYDAAVEMQNALLQKVQKSGKKK